MKEALKTRRAVVCSAGKVPRLTDGTLTEVFPHALSHLGASLSVYN